MPSPSTPKPPVWYWLGGELHRRCSQCHDYLPATGLFFRHQPQTAGGLHSMCRDCENYFDRRRRRKYLPKEQ